MKFVKAVEDNARERQDFIIGKRNDRGDPLVRKTPNAHIFSMPAGESCMWGKHTSDGTHLVYIPASSPLAKASERVSRYKQVIKKSRNRGLSC